MTLYPPKIGHERLAANSQSTTRRLAKLETRTAGIDSGFPLALVPGVISGSYTSGDPQVYFNGAMTLSGPYKYLTSYTPVANDSVILAPIGPSKTYVVLGRLSA